jgi:hypothetical protein
LSNKSSTKRGFVQKEIKQALEILEECGEGKVYLLPVRIEECKLPYEVLRELHYIDMFPNWYHGLDKILKVVFGYGESEYLRECVIKEIERAKEYDRRAGLLINKISKATSIYSAKIVSEIYMMRKDGILEWNSYRLEADSIVNLKINPTS